MGRPLVVTYGRPEWIADISLPALNQQVTLPTQGGQIPNDRFMKSLLLVWEGRITNAGANGPTGTQADAPFNLIDTIIVQGTHKVRGVFEQFINVRGSDMRQMAAMYHSKCNLSLVNPNGGTQVENTPANLNGANRTNLTTTVAQFNDIRFGIEVPFTPLGCVAAQQVDFLLDAPNYDSLKLLIQAADDQNVFTYGTRGAPTFSAFGSGTGSPRIRVYGVFAQAGKSMFQGFVPARVFRLFDEQNAIPALTASQAGQRIWNIPRGDRIRNMLLKTGTKSAAVAAGNNAYATLINTILTGNIKVQRGLNRTVRFWQDFYGLREDASQEYGFAPDLGYGMIDFAKHGTVNESLDLRGAIVGSQGDIDTYLQSDTTGAANQCALAQYEILRYLPQYPQ